MGLVVRMFVRRLRLRFNVDECLLVCSELHLKVFDKELHLHTEIRNAYRSGYTVLVATALLTALAWLYVLLA